MLLVTVLSILMAAKSPLVPLSYCSVMVSDWFAADLMKLMLN